MIPLTDCEHWQKRFCGRNEGASLAAPSLRTYCNYRLDQIFSQHIVPRNDLSILEVGCAYSTWALYFQSRFAARYYGIDLLEEGAAVARLCLEHVGQDPNQVWTGDFLSEACPARMSEYDVVYSCGLIEHFSEPGNILKCLYSSVKPGGILITIVPNLEGLFGFAVRWLFPALWRSHIVISPKDFAEWSAGLQCQELLRGYWGTLYPFVIPWDELVLPWKMDRILVYLLRQIDRPLSFLLRALPCAPETKFLSPYVIHVIRREE